MNLLTLSLLSSFFADFKFHPADFVDNLQYMGLGMLCIFVVIGVIIGVVMLLERLTSRGASADSADDDASGK